MNIRIRLPNLLYKYQLGSEYEILRHYGVIDELTPILDALHHAGSIPPSDKLRQFFTAESLASEIIERIYSAEYESYIEEICIDASHGYALAMSRLALEYHNLIHRQNNSKTIEYIHVQEIVFIDINTVIVDVDIEYEYE